MARKKRTAEEKLAAEFDERLNQITAPRGQLESELNGITKWVGILQQRIKSGATPRPEDVVRLRVLNNSVATMAEHARESGNVDDQIAATIVSSEVPKLYLAFCRMLSVQPVTVQAYPDILTNPELQQALEHETWVQLEAAAMAGDTPDWTDEYAPSWWIRHVFRINGDSPKNDSYKAIVSNRRTRPGGTSKRVSFDRHSLTRDERDRLEKAEREEKERS